MVCCCSVLGLFAQEARINFEKYELKNGLKVILHQDNSTPIVAVSVMYHVGSKNENPERTGFAHFFEHLMFEGSKNIGRGEYTNYVQSAGGTLNASTTSDRTYYFEILPSNQLELGLWLEAERMLHAVVDNKGVETQREVVKEERRGRYNQPYGGVLLEGIFKSSYKKHPYKWPVIGYMEHLNNASIEDFKQFYEDFYTPNNAILSIAGDIDPKEAKKLIEEYFGPIPKGKAVFRPDIVEPALTQERRDTIYDNVQLPAVLQIYRVPAQGTEDFYAIKMLSTLLSQGESSRLKRSLVDEQQTAFQVANIPIDLEDPGLSINFGIANVGVNSGDLEKAMDIEVEKVQKELITDEEFQKLRNQIESNFIASNTTVAGIAGSLATYEMFFGDANLINTEIDRYMAVTKEDIRRVAKEYFHKGNRVVLHYLPNPTKP